MSDQMVDWLNNVGKIGGEFFWITASKPLFHKHVGRSPSQINKSVLESTKIKDVVKKQVESRNCALKEIEKEAAQILTNMAHNYQLSSVKPIGYTVLKAIRRIFTSIFVNFSQLERLRLFSQDNPTIPIVFLPSHRSYFDFLLISLLCFDQQIQLPAIAAGEDFQSSKLLGEALRRCGAWFIKRSFGDDELYWAIFSEYVQSHLINNDRPFEFFVEGQRSRTMKSLPPKTGLLQTTLEPFFKGEVYDIVLMPVTINYEKLLEESLYAWELFGFPKPKETTSGLFKAREILSKNFGNVHCTFGEPISVRQHFSSCKKSADDYRLNLSCMPTAKFSLPEQLKNDIKDLAYLLVEQQNSKNVLNVWPVICSALLEISQKTSSILYPNVMKKSVQLLDLLAKLHIQITLLKGSFEADANYFFDLHNNYITINNGCIKFVEFSTDIDKPAKVLIEKSISNMITTNYSNLLISRLAQFCWIADSFSVQNSTPAQDRNLEDVWLYFELLQDVFGQEFVCSPINRSFSFSTTLDCLARANILHYNENVINVVSPLSIELLANLFNPWIESYVIILQEILALNSEQQVKASLFTSWCQQKVASTLESSARQGRVVCGSMSTDTIKNVYNTLHKMRYVFVENQIVRVNDFAVEELIAKLKRKVLDTKTNKAKI